MLVLNVLSRIERKHFEAQEDPMIGGQMKPLSGWEATTYATLAT
jgi:hypothetical protein